MTTRAMAVARVSKKKQATDDHYSIPAQLKAIRDYCEREGIDLVEEYVEPGTSAFVTEVTKIPGLHQALQRIEAGEGNALIVHESSRLARTERLTNEVADRLEAGGAKFINVSMGGFDYSTPEGRMILANEAAMNSYWSRKTGQHSKKGKQQQFEQGLHIGQIPFGYTHATVTVDGLTTTSRKVPMVIVPEESEAIRKGFEDFALGKNAHEITREWNEAGFKPRSTKGLDYFQPQTVRGILSNPIYMGYIQHLGETRKGLHEPIVTEAQYWAAQKPKAALPRREHPPRLLRGLATCPDGHRVYVLAVSHSPRNTHRKHFYYREPSPDFERPCSQAGKLWRASEPDAQVEALLKTMALDDAWLRYVEEQARSGGGRDTVRELARIEAKLERLQDEYLEGRLPKEKWERVFAGCQAQLAGVVHTEQPPAALQKKLGSWVELWDGASPEARNETCRLVLKEAVLDFDRREVRLVPWPEFLPLFDARVHYVGQERPGQG